jgi:hypothetical protein
MEAILIKGGASSIRSLREPRLWPAWLTTFQETGSISAIARLWNTSRQVVRKWDEGKPPLTVLKEFIMVLSIILDWISADLILSCDKEVGNDLLAHYTSDYRTVHYQMLPICRFRKAQLSFQSVINPPRR